MSFFKQNKPKTSANNTKDGPFIKPLARLRTTENNLQRNQNKSNSQELDFFGEPFFFQPAAKRQPKFKVNQVSNDPIIQTKKETLKERLDRITKSYKQMISAARKKGHNVAADNLQRFIDGTGGTKIESQSWLRSFGAITSAERVNQERFEESLSKLALKLGKGKTATHSDYWDRQLTGSQFKELYYASGTSTITSTGKFTLTRRGDKITITGSVDHKWHDPYDWHAGLTAYIPGFGSISDADALLLQKHRGAKPFDMESSWTQKFSGTYIIDDFLYFDYVDYKWTGP